MDIAERKRIHENQTYPKEDAARTFLKVYVAMADGQLKKKRKTIKYRDRAAAVSRPSENDSLFLYLCM